MSEYTKHYNLKKPTQSENYNVEDANLNNEIIDNVLYGKADKEPGKGMSTNDFTDNYKKKIDTMQTLYRPMGTVDTIQALQSISTKKVGDLYRCKQDENNYVWNGQEWVNIGQDADYSELTQQIEQVKQSQQELVDDMSKTFTGTNITAETVAGVGRVNKVRGFCKQETREGYNLLKNTATNTTSNGIEVTVNEDGTVKLNGTATANVYVWLNSELDITNGSISLNKISGTGNATLACYDENSENSVTNTSESTSTTAMKSNIKYTKIRLVVFKDTVCSNLLVGAMVLKSNQSVEKPEYEPYGASPSSNFPAKVHSLGDDVNLFGATKNDFENGETLGAAKKVVFNLKPNTQYTCSSNDDTGTVSETNIWLNGNSSTFDGVFKNHSRTVVTDENGKLFIAIRTTQIEKFFDGTYYIKLQEGTVATPWSPFGYGTTTNKSENRNILKSYKNTSFTPTDTSWYDLNGKSGLAGKGLASKTDCKFWVDKGKTYTVNIEQMANANPFQLCKDSETIINGRNNAGKITFVADFDGYVIPRVKAVQANVSTWIKNVMVCEGTEESNYVPHEEDTQTIYLKEPLLGIDDVEDELDLSNKEIERKFVKTKLDNVGNHWNTPDQSSYYYLDFFYLNSKPKANGLIMSSYFKHNKVNGIWIGSQSIAVQKAGCPCSTFEEFKTWIAEQDIEVIYELATPIIEHIDCSDKIKQYDGQTTIYNTDGAELKCTLTNNRAIAQINQNLQKIEEMIAGLRVGE